MPDGNDPTAMDPVTAFVAVATTETAPASSLATYNFEPFGVIARAIGSEFLSPTVIVAAALLFEASITDTVPWFWLAT